MKKVIIIFRLLAFLLVFAICFASLAWCSMTKMYIGNEEDQVIVGIEAISGERDGGAGMEIRTYFRKNGVIVNGEEYAAKPGKVRYTLLACGKNDFGSLMKFRRSWAATSEQLSENDDLASLRGYTQIELGYGEGPHILYP